MAPNTTVHQALSLLLPTLTSTSALIPAQLISQSESLIALSRQRAHNLKQDEEIARAHACCEIACRRLRSQLRLPAIKSGAGAPCKPRVYTKLVAFLEGVLADAPVGALTPKGRKRGFDGEVKESSGSVRASVGKSDGYEVSSSKGARGGDNPDQTPSKRQKTTDKLAGSEFAGKIRGSAKKAALSVSTIAADDKAPDFVLPTVRKLCRLFSTQQMIPHVYTGTCIVLGLADLWPLDDDAEEIQGDTEAYKSTITALLFAVYLMVLTRMRKGNMTELVYHSVLRKGLAALQKKEGAAATMAEEVESWVARLNAEGWCEGLDWWDSVPENVLTLGSKDRIEDGPVDGEGAGDAEDDEVVMLGRRSAAALGTNGRRGPVVEQDEDPDGVLLPGLGTMLHDGIDYLSADRKIDFAEWKEDILKRMASAEKTPVRKTKRSGALSVAA